MTILKEITTKSFDNREAMFLALKSRKKEIIAEKKSQIKELKNNEVPLLKEFNYSKAPFPTKKGHFYAVINSTNLMDSHDDVHLETIWNKSAIEKNGKTFYVLDHDLSVNGMAVHSSDVNIQLHKANFKDIGVDIDHDTTLLVYEMPEDSILHDKMKTIVSSRKQLENSIRMEYVNVIMCVNSESEELKEERADYIKYIDKVANKSQAQEQGYFFAVTEAKIIDEGSGVLKGSNYATPIFYHEDIEPRSSKESTQAEPSKDTHEIDYENLTKKFSLK